MDIIGNWEVVKPEPKYEEGEIAETPTVEVDENPEEDSDCVVMENAGLHE